MKTNQLFERLWEHSRTLRRVGLVLVMCLMAIPQVWGYSMEIYFCPEDLWGEYWDESTKYCQLNLNKRCNGNDAWETYSMTKTAWTKDGKAIWKGNPTNLCNDGAQQIQFLRKLKSDNYQEWSNQVYDGWMMYNSTNTFYYGSWQALSKDQVVNGGYVYFDNSATQWSNTYKYLVIGHNSYSRVYQLTQISNTNLWYVYLDDKDNHVWEDATYCAFIGSNSSWSDGDWGPGNVSTASKYTATFPVNYSNSILSGKFYLYRPVSSSDGTELNRDRYDAYGGLNWDITFKAKIKAFGEDSYAEGTSKGKVTVKRYTYGNATSCGSSASTDVLAVGGTSGIYAMGYVSTRCTLTVANVVTGYTFRGWYAGGTKLSDDTPYRTYSPKATTVYAYFEENSYTITYNNMDGATNHPSNPSSYGITSSTITLQAPTKSGYTFAGWCSDEDCTTPVSSIPSGSTGNKVFYAKWLSAHEPGKYVTATGSGGYGKTLKDVSGTKYERYLFGVSSSKVYVGADAAVTSKGSSCVLSYATATGNLDSGGEWLFGTSIYNQGSGTQDISGTEFASCGSVYGLKYKTEGQGLLLRVKGYSEFAIVAKDNDDSKSKNKYLQVLIDGSDVTDDLSTEKTVRRYSLTAGTAYTIQVKSLSSSENQFWGFSLKPGTPTITVHPSTSSASYDVGDAATALSVTATKLVSSGTTLSYQWYSNTTASNSGGTIIDGATSASYTPPTTSAGTTYYYCVVSETGCNSATSNVSGAITVTASCTTPTIAWSTSPANGNVGGNMTISVTSNYPAGVTITSNNSNATLTGRTVAGSTVSYTLNYAVAGNANITASVDGDGSTVCDETIDLDAVAITVKSAPTVGTFTPASGATIKSGTTVTVTGSTGSTVYYQWGTSSAPANAAAVVSGGTAGTSGAATVTTTGISSSNTYLYAVASEGGVNSTISSASYTIDDTKPTLSSSVPANSATDVNTSGTIVLTFSEAIASVDGSKFTLTNATKGAVAIDGSDNTKVNIAYSGASYSTTVTLATAAGAVADAAGNTSAALSSISFTTKAEPTLTALEEGTLYTAQDMASDECGTLSGTSCYSSGVSSNTMFMVIGDASKTDQTGGTPESKTCDKVTLNGNDFTTVMWLKGQATLSSKIPEDRALKFMLPKAGSLTIYYRDNNDSKAAVNLAKSGSDPCWESGSKGNHYETKTGLSDGTYYIYADKGSTAIYGLYYDKAPEFVSSTPANGATDVAVSGTIVLTFDESIESVTAAKYSLSEGTISAVAIDGTDATKVNITYSGLPGSTEVTLSVAAGAVTDAAGNKSAALSAITFTTESTGYAITNGSPTGGTIAITDGLSDITEAEEDAKVYIAATPETGYEFTSWDVYKTGTPATKVSTGSTASTSFTMPSYAVTVDATFTAIDYAITHSAATNGTYTISVAGGSATDENTTANYGQTITLAATPSSHYKLQAWNVTCGGDPVAVTNNQFSMPAGNVTIAPTFGEVYTVTFNSNGGSSVDAIEQSTVGGAITMPDAPTKDDYTFVNWMIGGTTKDAGDSYTPTANVTAYATWKSDDCAGGGGSTTLISITPTITKDNKNNSSASASGTPGGTAYWDKMGTSTPYKLNENGAYFALKLSSGYYQATDVLVINGADGAHLVYYGSHGSGTYLGTTGSPSSGTINFTLTGLPSSVDEIYVYRTNDTYNKKLSSISVTRSGGTCKTVTYHGNGATSGYVNDPVQHTAGSDVTVKYNDPTTGFKRTGYEFNGWNTKADASGTRYDYWDIDHCTIEDIAADVDLYAEWRIVINADNTDFAGKDSPTQYKDVKVTNGATLTITNATTIRDIIVTDDATLKLRKNTTAHDVTVETGSTLNINTTNGDGTGDGITLTANSLSLQGGFNELKSKYDMPRVYINPKCTLTRTDPTINFDISVNHRNYYPIALPFDVALNNVDYADSYLASISTYGMHYEIDEYDGQKRANSGGGTGNWKRVEPGATLKAGKGYIMSAITDGGKAIIRFPMNVPNGWTTAGEQGTYDAVTKNEVAVYAYTKAEGETKKANKGWNLLGVPYMSCFVSSEMDADPSDAYIKGLLNIWSGEYKDGDNNIYVTIPKYDFTEYDQLNITEAVLLPGWCFFVQMDEDATITFDKAGERARAPFRATNSNQAKPTVKTGIILSGAEASDKTTILVSDKYNAAEYEINADLEKMFGENGYTLATYSLSGETRLAYNAMSNADAENIIPIGYRAPADGEYTFSINPRYAENGAFESVNLIDYETGIVTDLLMSSYTFSTDRTQNDARFALNVVKQKETPTDIELVGGEGLDVNAPRKLLLDGRMFIILDGKMFDAQGKRVK